MRDEARSRCGSHCRLFGPRRKRRRLRVLDAAANTHGSGSRFFPATLAPCLPAGPCRDRHRTATMRDNAAASRLAPTRATRNAAGFACAGRGHQHATTRPPLFPGDLFPSCLRAGRFRDRHCNALMARYGGRSRRSGSHCRRVGQLDMRRGLSWLKWGRQMRMERADFPGDFSPSACAPAEFMILL